MYRVNPDGCAKQSNHPCGGFFVWGSHRFESSSTTNLSGTNWNGAAGPQGEYQDDASKSQERFGTAQRAARRASRRMRRVNPDG